MAAIADENLEIAFILNPSFEFIWRSSEMEDKTNAVDFAQAWAVAYMKIPTRMNEYNGIF